MFEGRLGRGEDSLCSPSVSRETNATNKTDSSMNVYTYSEARRWLAAALDEAEWEGEVRITRRDGRTFTLRPVSKGSPLDVPPVEEADVTLEDVNQFVQEGRTRTYDYERGE